MILDDYDYIIPEVIIPTDNFNPAYYANTSSTLDVFVKTTVKDEFGDLLIGAALQNLNNKTKGTTTDFNGKIEFYAKPTDVLEISYLGYKSQQFNAAAMPAIVVLKEEAESLDTVWITPTPTPIQTVQPTPAPNPIAEDKTMLYVGIGVAALAGLVALSFLTKKQKGLGAPAKTCNNRTKCIGLRRNGTLKKGFKYGTGGKVIKTKTARKPAKAKKGLNGGAVSITI